MEHRYRTNSTSYRLSAMAERDLANILDYTVDVFGERQAEEYLGSIEECFARIAQMPLSGRSCKSLHPELRRIEHQKHVIFYAPDAQDVLIARVLHESMMPAKHKLIEDDRA